MSSNPTANTRHPPPLAERRARSVITRLRAAGYVAYFAGGCVRDRLLGHEPSDFDVATDAPAAKVQELFRRTVRDMLDRAAQGEAFPNLERARYRRNKTYVVKLCVQAVNRLFEASGGQALLESAAIQRCHRDIHAASHHQGISWDAAAEDFGRQALGLSPAPPRYSV